MKPAILVVLCSLLLSSACHAQSLRPATAILSPDRTLSVPAGQLVRLTAIAQPDCGVQVNGHDINTNCIVVGPAELVFGCEQAVTYQQGAAGTAKTYWMTPPNSSSHCYITAGKMMRLLDSRGVAQSWVEKDGTIVRLGGLTEVVGPAHVTFIAFDHSYVTHVIVPAKPVKL